MNLRLISPGHPRNPASDLRLSTSAIRLLPSQLPHTHAVPAYYRLFNRGIPPFDSGFKLNRIKPNQGRGKGPNFAFPVPGDFDCGLKTRDFRLLPANPSATHHQIILIKHRRLPRRNRPLRHMQLHLRLVPINRKHRRRPCPGGCNESSPSPRFAPAVRRTESSCTGPR